ncbi:immunoglobulin superfamily member 1-like [Podarcis lilfordi]|nr:immunoglobulin superfamily member 1-like [Podarcis lilfordi]
MTPVLSIILYWLLSYSGGNGFEKETLPILHSSTTVNSPLVASLGGNVTIICDNPYNLAMNISLVKDGIVRISRSYTSTKLTFLITNVSRMDGGMYTCQNVFSDRSSPEEEPRDFTLLIRDPSFPKPVLSLEPMEEITIGQRVTMHCGTQGEVKRSYSAKG